MDGDEPAVYVRHLLICDRVTYDLNRPDSAYTLHNVIVTVHPPDPDGYPVLMEWPWVFVQLYGTPGQYRLELELVRVDDLTGDEAVVHRSRPRMVSVRPDRFMSGAGLRLPQVHVPEPGMYEFRLYVNGSDEPAAVEPIYAEEWRE